MSATKNKLLLGGLFAGALSLCGCASLPPSVQREEAVWQTLNVADAYTTYQGVVRHPEEFSEVGAWRVVGGEHPNATQVAIAAAASAGLHLLVTNLLVEHNAPRWLTHGWQFLTITDKGLAVANNVHELNAYHERIGTETNTQPVPNHNARAWK